jgi:hypothetical protein
MQSSTLEKNVASEGGDWLQAASVSPVLPSRTRRIALDFFMADLPFSMMA